MAEAGDPLLELCRRLHQEKADTDSDLIGVRRVAELLRETRFEADFERTVIAELGAGGPLISHEAVLRAVGEAEKHLGKQPLLAAVPVRANPGLGGVPLVELRVDPWKRTLGQLPAAEPGRRPVERLDVDCVMLAVYEVVGTLFKHATYKVEVSYGTYGDAYVNSAVVRRYSDFAWLHTYLASKYPFRAVPPVPPKQLATLLGSDELELARHRVPGLHAFAVAVLVHPVFARDATVRAFLANPRPFAEWREQNAEADFTDEYERLDPARHADEEPAVDFAAAPLAPLADDRFFEDARESMLQLAEQLKAMIQSTQHMSLALLTVADESAALVGSIHKLLPLFKDSDMSEVSGALRRAQAESGQVGQDIRVRSVRRLMVMYTMVLALHDCLGRLGTSTYADFPALSRGLASLQEQLERCRLRDGPLVPSSEQASLVNQLRRGQRLYLHHHQRNEWAAATAKQEAEQFITGRTGEIVLALQDLARLLE